MSRKGGQPPRSGERHAPTPRGRRRVARPAAAHFYLIIGHYIVTYGMVGLHQRDPGVYARFKRYPGGLMELLVCSKPIFRGEGWEAERPSPKSPKNGTDSEEDAMRAVRRARARVRELALCTPFKYFVTLTLDERKINRHDIDAITAHMRTWLDNRVRRKGLTYVLVPELHKDGAIHFHGFFNDALPAVDSGTVIPPWGGRPRRPESVAEGRRWLADGGHTVYNLPDWDYGFTTAIELYGEYSKAVSYVCKYIGKDLKAGKIGGRWYYSGGALGCPEVWFSDMFDWNSAFDTFVGAPGVSYYDYEVPEIGAAFRQFTWQEPPPISE